MLSCTAGRKNYWRRAPAIQATLRNITEHNRLKAELQILATTDVLTGIVNRRQFLALASRELKRAARLHHPLALAMLDMDGLKHINDTHGHAAGDQVLVAFTDTCRKNIREIDVFARVGGDEFVVLLPETEREEAYKAVERVQLALAAQPVYLGGQPVIVTFSAGITSMTDMVESLDELLARADSALYRAKAAGRNRVAL